MRTKKRYTALFTVLGLAVACLAAGVLFAPPAPTKPIKILMPNQGGRVIFNHRAHAEDYGDKCSTCHHVEIESTIWDRDIHELHVDNFVDSCQDCHHDSSIEPEPQSCFNCHERLLPAGLVNEKSRFIPARDAIHMRCASCHAHEDTFAEGLAGCETCHDMQPPADNLQMYSACASCHTQPPFKEVLPDRLTIYHTQCGDCHAKVEKGPLVDDQSKQCYQCHVR